MIRNGSAQSGKGACSLAAVTRRNRAFRRNGLRRFGALLAAALWAIATPVSAQPSGTPPQRIVSLSLCADQLLLALADPTQIAALSPASTDPLVSYEADAASRYWRVISGVEAIVDIAPDVVFADANDRNAVIERLERLGYPIIRIEPVATIDAAIAQIHEIAALLGQEQAGETLVQTIEIARLQAARSDRGYTAISFRGDDDVPGEDSLITNLLSVVGLTNIGESLSDGDGHVPLEVLIASPPDFLVVPEARSIADRETSIIDHPALARVFPLALRLEIADNLTICGGPALPAALRRISSEFGRVQP